MLEKVKSIMEIDEDGWESLWRNMKGITDSELDWKPHPTANNVRWIIGHLTWFQEWVHDAIKHEDVMASIRARSLIRLTPILRCALVLKRPVAGILSA